MLRVRKENVRTALAKGYGLRASEIETVIKYADEQGKYDDGKFLVLKEATGYAIELS